MKKIAKGILFLCIMVSFFPVSNGVADCSQYVGVAKGESFTFKVSIESNIALGFEFTLQITEITETTDACTVAFTMTGIGNLSRYGFSDASSQYIVKKTSTDPSPSQYIINKKNANKSYVGSYGGFVANANWDEQGILMTLAMDGGENSFSYTVSRVGRFTNEMMIVEFFLAGTVVVSVILGKTSSKNKHVIGRAELRKFLEESAQKEGKIDLTLLSKKLRMTPKRIELAFVELLGLGSIDGTFEGHIFQLKAQSPEIFDQIVNHLATWSESRSWARL